MTLRIAIVGAESTGKTALAQALAERVADLSGLRCTWVGEWLRSWCEREGRTPRPDEQAAIAQHQQGLIELAAANHELVVCDTTALMTAVYSEENSAGCCVMALAKPNPAFTSARKLAMRWACFSDSASSLSAVSARSSGKPLPTKLANCLVQTANS